MGSFLFSIMYKKNDYLRERQELEQSKNGRSPFRRDYARLLHSPSFRRLQGKTQLFPSNESDFVRNRLTHSLEVAQITKGLAESFNSKKNIKYKIDLDLVEFAGLAHDLGHPPFGHNGEKALDECMKHFGGFEGNAQTLRILTRIERKIFADGLNQQFVHGISEDAEDKRLGLNLTYRALASILKYDEEIPILRDSDSKIVKGYYASESEIVKNIKQSVAGKNFQGKFKTIECQLMDIADDIAYSTYDFEDSMKAGFTSPLEVISWASTPSYMEKLKEKIQNEIPEVSEDDILNALIDTIGSTLRNNDSLTTYQESKLIAENSYLRTKLTSELVHKFMSGVSIKINEEIPALSKVIVSKKIKLQIEVLKHINYLMMIMSPRLKVVEFRGGEIVKTIFQILSSKEGKHLLPKDVRIIHDCLKTEIERKRTICDFVAGMTDRYAVDFYSRLKGNASSMFVPL